MPRYHRTTVWVLLLLPAGLTAQTPESQLVGHRIRILTRCEASRPVDGPCHDSTRPYTLTGRLQSIEGSTLHLQVSGADGEQLIPVGSVSRLSLFDGRKANGWPGAGIGLIGGALVGGLIGSTSQFCILQCGPATGLGVVIGAPVGFLLGGMVGAIIGSDKWRDIPLKGGRLRLTPRLDAVGATARIAF